MALEGVLTVVEAVTGGRGEEKLKVGKAEVLMGSEMAGRSGTSTTWKSEISYQLVCNFKTESFQ